MRNGARSKGRLSRLLLAGALWAAAAPSQAEIQVLPGVATDVDQATVEAVLTTFRQADDAMHSRNLDGVMALYAEQYNYHGLKKADMMKIWRDLFDEFRELSNVHQFSRIVKVGSGSQTIVEVICTGSLSGLSKTSGLLVPIDSWYGEVHYLTLEEGRWRIRGNLGDSPRIMPFGTSPHPLF